MCHSLGNDEKALNSNRVDQEETLVLRTHIQVPAMALLSFEAMSKSPVLPKSWFLQ